jgi:hypothetical protein
MNLSAYVAGVGVLGPGFNDWAHAKEILTGRQSWVQAPTQLPAPSLLPPAERRRTGRVVKLALAVALEATRHAKIEPGSLASVFSASGSDGYVCHELCQVLATAAREVSPTRFANSVHNAASGYWSIATGAMAESNVVCAFDASFSAGLIEAMTQVQVDGKNILLVAYDTEYPEPLHSKRPIPDAFGIALVLTPKPGEICEAKLSLEFSSRDADRLAEPDLEALRTAIPAARGLPLLRNLALGDSSGVALEYLPPRSVMVCVEPCD